MDGGFRRVQWLNRVWEQSKKHVGGKKWWWQGACGFEVRKGTFSSRQGPSMA